MLNTKPAKHDPDQGHELLTIVFHEENVVITDLKLGRVANNKAFISNCATQHLNGICAVDAAFDSILNLKRDVALNVSLRTLPFPNRANISHRSLEDQLGLLN